MIVHRLTARPPERPSVRTTRIPMFTLIHSRFFGSPLIAHQCYDQLTAVKTRYPVTNITWPYRGLRCRPIQVEYFFVVIRWRVTSFQMIAGSFFKFIWNMLCLCHYGPALLTFWFQTDLGRENSANYLKCKQGRQMLFTFLTIVRRWSRSRFTSNFYAMIGKNLTDEFMEKIYAAYCDLFTLTEFCVNLWCF